MKTCRVCKQEKQLTEFTQRKSNSYYLSECKPCINHLNKERYKRNPEARREYGRAYGKNNRTKILKRIQELHKTNPEIRQAKLEYSRKFYSENKQYYYERHKKYTKNNPERMKALRDKYYKEKYGKDIFFTLKITLRNRLNSALDAKFWKKTSKFSEYIGCTLEQLQQHLESKFTEGMSWENRGDWHLDHILPLSSAKTEEELYKLCHYTNLQPLWAVDNLIKADKVLNL